MDLLVSGGVDGCLNSIFKQRRQLSEISWNKWLSDNFNGTYIVCNCFLFFYFSLSFFCKCCLFFLIFIFSYFFFDFVFVDNGEAHGGEQWLSNGNVPPKRQFHIGYGHETCRSTVMFELAMHNALFNETVLLNNTKRPKSSESKFLVYINSNCVHFRENAFATLAVSFPNNTLYYWKIR